VYDLARAGVRYPPAPSSASAIGFQRRARSRRCGRSDHRCSRVRLALPETPHPCESERRSIDRSSAQPCAERQSELSQFRVNRDLPRNPSARAGRQRLLHSKRNLDHFVIDVQFRWEYPAGCRSRRSSQPRGSLAGPSVRAPAAATLLALDRARRRHAPPPRQVPALMAGAAVAFEGTCCDDGCRLWRPRRRELLGEIHTSPAV